MMSKRNGVLGLMAALAFAVVGGSPGTAGAVAFSSDLSISGQTVLDGTGFSFSDSGATGAGVFTAVAAGTSSSTAYTADDGADTSTGVRNITDLGDGLGLTAALDTTGLEEFAVGIDITIDLTNLSPTDTYEVTFEVSYENRVDADGVDSYLHSEFSVQDPGGEVFFTDLLSDSANGDEMNGAVLSSLGAFLQDPAGPGRDIASFMLTLLPGGTAQVLGIYTMTGGLYDDTDSLQRAFLNFGGFLSVTAVTNVTQPPNPVVPEPGTLVLLGSGLLGVAGRARRTRSA